MIRRLLRFFSADGWAWILAVVLFVAGLALAVARRAPV